MTALVDHLTACGAYVFIETLVGSNRQVLDSGRARVVVSLVGLLGNSLGVSVGVSPHLRSNLVRMLPSGSEQLVADLITPRRRLECGPFANNAAESGVGWLSKSHIWR